MLRLLRIRNLALIKELEIEFDAGLNLLTGETGSGKSILVDALGLLLGARPSQEVIRSDCEMAILEGVFDIASCSGVLGILTESGFAPEDDSLLIRREISNSGRNRVFINSHLATVSLLKEVGDRLADIHGQQEQRSLLDLSTHLEWLDDFGDNAELLNEVRTAYRKLHETARQLSALQKDEQERLRRIDMLQFQTEDIHHVNPQPGEREALEEERNILVNREKILGLATEAYSALYECESSILGEIARLAKMLEELERFDKSWSPHREILEDTRYKLQDVAFMARDYAAGADFSPERLEQVHQRLYALEKLTKKYGASIEDVLEFLGRCTKELAELRSFAESSARLEQQLQQDSKTYRALADKLSEKRHKDAERLQSAIRREFSALAMERMQLLVQFRSPENHGTGPVPAFYGRDGIDHVEFLIAPNKGEEMKALAKIASGGELSRLMLAIKSLCGGDEINRTLVFDEVDAGIGGRVAEAVGRRLRDLSRECQVLCVTHLPQIAAFAGHHFNVSKKAVSNRTETFIRRLSEQDRIEELARMLGGETITQTARSHALEMLEYSRESQRKERQQR
jgi:DNA repair protein RecN (Recombination protein N)